MNVIAMRIRFVSRNDNKVREVAEHLHGRGIDIVPVRHGLQELQTSDVDELIRDKCLRAFAYAGRPLIVEHSGLRLDAMNGLPGGLTQVFWDHLLADRFCELYGRTAVNGVEARSTLAYCDGRRIAVFTHAVRGSVTPEPRGTRAFQWDCVFVPEGGVQTFAEMGPDKKAASMRTPALDRLAAHLGAPP